MGSIIVIEVLPGSKFGIEIHIIGVGQQLVKLGLIRSMRPFGLAIELGGSWFDVDMLYALIFNMPMELGLKLMSAIGPYGADPEGKLIDHIIHELDGTILIVL